MGDIMKNAKKVLFPLLAVLLMVPLRASQPVTAHGIWPWVVPHVTASTKGDLVTLSVMLENRNSHAVHELDVIAKVPHGATFVESWAGHDDTNRGVFTGSEVKWFNSQIAGNGLLGPFVLVVKVNPSSGTHPHQTLTAKAYVRWSKSVPGDAVREVPIANPLETLSIHEETIDAEMLALVHAGYIDVSANVNDLRTQIGNWEKGQDSGRRIALEKVERLEATTQHIPWPTRELDDADRELRAALHDVEHGLTDKELAEAQEALAKVSGAFHTMTHAFYDKWVASMRGRTGTVMVHTVYADVAANVNDLRTQIANWESGQDSGRRIALEKVDRLEALGEHIAWPTAKLRTASGEIHEALHDLDHALQGQELEEAKESLAKVSGAFHDLTHGFYDEWVASAQGLTGHAMSHIGYLDVASNINDLRSQMANWETGQDSGRRIALEKVDRLNALVNHQVWPKELANPMFEIAGALLPLDRELEAKNLELAKKHLGVISEAFHSLTHAFYDGLEPARHVDLPAAPMPEMAPAAEAPMPAMEMPAAPPLAPALDSAMVAQGRAIFSSAGCAACHGAGGEGGLGPRLTGHFHSADLISGVVRGGQGTMPAFGPDRISDLQLQALIVFVQSLAQ